MIKAIREAFRLLVDNQRKILMYVEAIKESQPRKVKEESNRLSTMASRKKFRRND